MTANPHLFVWTTQSPDTTPGKLVAQLNQSLRGLNHDMQRQIMFSDHLARTITVAHTFGAQIKMTKITAPATIANVGQLFVDTADGKLKFLGGSGTLTPLANP